MNTNDSGKLFASVVLWQAFRAYAHEREAQRKDSKPSSARGFTWSTAREQVGDAFVAVRSYLRQESSATGRA